MVIFSFLITAVLIVYFAAAKSFEGEYRIKSRIDSFVMPEQSPAAEKKQSKSGSKQVMGSLIKKLRDYYNSTLPSKNEIELQKKLLQAGNPLNMTTADYYIINTIVRIAVPLLFGAYGILLGLNLYKIILLALIGFLLSFKALDFYISGRKKKRYRKALRELPDFLDVLTISVEAGLGFDIALNKTIEKGNGILCSEFYTCLEEMRLGRTRKEALIGVKERLNFSEMISFINSIVQSERLGTGIVQVLRAKSEDERDKRKQRAEEAAMKTSIKILFPLLFLIFPSIFIIVIGPAALQLIKAISGIK